MDYYVGSNMYSDDALQHHGIIGQKWGVRRTPEQLGHKPSGSRHKGSSKSFTERAKARQAKRKRQKNLEKARKTLDDKRTYQQKKEAALATGSAEDILKFKGDLTNKELQDSVTRIRLEKDLASLAANSAKNQDILKSVSKKMGDVSTLVTNGTNLYNGVAKVLNSMVDDSTLPIIGEKGDKRSAREIRAIKNMIRRSDPDEILSNANRFTSAEIAEALKRVNAINALNKMASS